MSYTPELRPSVAALADISRRVNALTPPRRSFASSCCLYVVTRFRLERFLRKEFAHHGDSADESGPIRTHADAKERAEHLIH